MAHKGSATCYILVLLGNSLFSWMETSALDIMLEPLDLQVTQDACILSSTWKLHMKRAIMTHLFTHAVNSCWAPTMCGHIFRMFRFSFELFLMSQGLWTNTGVPFLEGLQCVKDSPLKYSIWSKAWHHPFTYFTHDLSVNCVPGVRVTVNEGQ